MKYRDLEKIKSYRKKYYQDHKKEKDEYAKKYRQTHKKEVSILHKNWRDKNSNLIYSYQVEYLRNNPWVQPLRNARQRCCNPKTKNYHRYGGRGIKILITIKEIREIWFRDKARDMKCPTIDRINNDMDYSFSNCRFIEREENIRKSNKGGV